MPLASELLADIVNAPVTERDIRTSCPTCHRVQSLAQALMSYADPIRTIYLCRNGCGPILIVGLAIDGTWPPHRGHPAGAYLIRNPRDLFVTLEDETDVVFAGRRNALD